MKKTIRDMETRRAGATMKHLLLAMRARVDERLRGHGVTSAQLKFLHELRLKPGVSGARLARECMVTPQTAQAMLVRSVKAGWVVRGADKENGRLVTATLTPAGEKLLEYAEQVVREFEAEVWAGISAEEVSAVNAILDRALGNVEEKSS